MGDLPGKHQRGAKRDNKWVDDLCQKRMSSEKVIHEVNNVFCSGVKSFNFFSASSMLIFVHHGCVIIYKAKFINKICINYDTSLSQPISCETPQEILISLWSEHFFWHRHCCRIGECWLSQDSRFFKCQCWDWSSTLLIPTKHVVISRVCFR